MKKKKNKKIILLAFHMFLFVTVFFFHSTGYNKVLAGYMSNETNVLKLGQKDPKISRNKFEDVQTVIDDATIAEQVEAKQTINHTWELIETVDAKCFEDGHNTYVCSDCGATYTETIPMTGHDWADDVVAPTCTERGYTRHTCWKCWETHTDNYVPALGHDYAYDREDVVESDNKVKKYYAVYKCSRCGDEYKEFLRAEFGYAGEVQEFVVEKDGIYKIDAWGAQGGGNGGKGGYISGEVELHEGDVLYIAVGGQGGNGSSNNNSRSTTGGQGGYNGGGNGGNGSGSKYRNNYYTASGSGGGGATSISTTDGTLAEHDIDTYDEEGLIVAGGGGGVGGGTNAKNVDPTGGRDSNTNGSLGQGSNGRQGWASGSTKRSNGAEGNGGGGGGYRGGKTVTDSGAYTDAHGYGGSSWANPDEVENVTTQAGVQSGNGKCTIEFVSDLPVEEPEEELPEPEEDTTPEDEEPTPTEEVTE